MSICKSQEYWNNFVSNPRPTASEIDSIYKMFDPSAFLKSSFWFDPAFIFTHCPREHIKTFCRYFKIPRKLMREVLARAPPGELAFILRPHQ
jgi:hypothetical protein